MHRGFTFVEIFCQDGVCEEHILINKEGSL